MVFVASSGSIKPDNNGIFFDFEKLSPVEIFKLFPTKSDVINIGGQHHRAAQGCSVPKMKYRKYGQSFENTL